MRDGAAAARQAHNLEVGGSNPSLATQYCEVEQRQLARLITWRSGVRIPPSLLNLLRGGAEAARQAHNLEVGGSNPSPATQSRGVAQLAERRSPKPKVAGSIPATPACFNKQYSI